MEAVLIATPRLWGLIDPHSVTKATETQSGQAGFPKSWGQTETEPGPEGLSPDSWCLALSLKPDDFLQKGGRQVGI